MYPVDSLIKQCLNIGETLLAVITIPSVIHLFVSPVQLCIIVYIIMQTNICVYSFRYIYLWFFSYEELYYCSLCNFNLIIQRVLLIYAN